MAKNNDSGGYNAQLFNKLAKYNKLLFLSKYLRFFYIL